MKAKVRLIVVPAILLMFLCGCDVLEKQAKNPDSTANKLTQSLEAAGKGLGEAAPAAGPYGWIVGGVATALTAVAGMWKVYKKGVVIQEKDTRLTEEQVKLLQVRQVTAAIVSAIEEASKIKIPESVAKSKDGTLGGAVKEKVKEELEKNKIAAIGKAVISGIKAK